MGDETTRSKFDPETWARMGFEERMHVATEEYVLNGMAYPGATYVFHVAKILVLGGLWMFFCSFTPGLGNPLRLGEWFFHPIAFQKAFIWGCCFEALGLGCMSGPLGLKIWPPFTAALHYARPGTTKLAWFPNAPIIGGNTRNWFNVATYVAFILSMLWALVQPELTTAHLLPIIVLLFVCTLSDRMIFLTARGEHHFAMIVCFAIAGNWIAAAKWVQLAVWFWAGVSKLTIAFSYVVPIMTANNPLLKATSFRKALFRDYPDDLHPSLLGKVMAHAGTFLEFATPLTLVFVTQDGPLLYLGLFFAIALHGFIISNMPIAAVFEWNLLSLYAAFFLFGMHPEVSLFEVGSVVLTLYLIGNCLVLPAWGNLVPSAVSFLVAMRYYAGNWAWNAWLFHGDGYKKLHKLKRAAPLLLEQQQKYLSPEDAVRADAGFLAFRAMHLQGRVLGMLLPQATDGRPFQEYTYADGETVSGSINGWNFGEGHLHDEQFIANIQEQVGFEEGECRVICVEAQPILGSTLHWRIVDAKKGLLDEGYVELSELMKRKPWDVGPV